MGKDDKGGRHDDKSQHDGSKSGGGSGRFEKPKDDGRHSGGKDKK